MKQMVIIVNGMISEELNDERLMNNIESKITSSDDIELRETVSKFVDDIIEDAVSKYNMFGKRKMAEEEILNVYQELMNYIHVV